MLNKQNFIRKLTALSTVKFFCTENRVSSIAITYVIFPVSTLCRSDIIINKTNFGHIFTFHQDCAPSHSAHKTVQLLPKQTHDFISPSLWSAIELPLELLYADDLVLIPDSETELIQKLNQWKDGLARKGMKVNISKTKIGGWRRATMWQSPVQDGHVQGCWMQFNAVYRY